MAAPRQAVLNYFCSYLHRGHWREVGSPYDTWMDFEHWKVLAQTAERGKFHSLFIADTLSLLYAEQSPEAFSRNSWLLRLEPATLGAALASHTENIGIAVTMNTTYTQPYNVARTLATLDHVSGGRAGWNVVTGHQAAEAPNFGMEAPPGHADRYRQGAEYFDVVTGLWDSWEDDAFPRDKESGVYLDPAKVHTLNHTGEFYAVKGPLNIARPPQGWPVIAQAGASKDGRAFAARIAEMMYTMLEDLGDAQGFYAEMKGMVENAGRPPDHLKILPHLHVVVAETDAEAQEKLEELNGLVDPVVGIEMLNQFLYTDLSGYSLDDPLPEIPMTERHQTRVKFMVDMARRDNRTIRDMIGWTGSFGAWAGSPATIADRIEEWIRTDACDGFNVFFPDAWRSLPRFVDLVVPELQRRGLFRTEYVGKTLRENLGLPRPANRFARDSVSS
jgi:alkanesulfonate monooxygenase